MQLGEVNIQREERFCIDFQAGLQLEPVPKWAQVSARDKRDTRLRGKHAQTINAQPCCAATA